MKLLRLLLFSAAAPVFFYGCSLFTSPDTMDARHLYPVSVGNYWLYDVQEIGNDGTVINESSQTTEIVSTQIIDRFDGFAVDFGNGTQGIFYYFHDDLSLYMDSLVIAQTLIRYPMDAGGTLLLFSYGYSDNYYAERILLYHGQNESVTVPQGTFSCYHYEIVTNIDTFSVLKSSVSQDCYYAPNVGLIEEIDYDKVDGVKKKFLTKELTSYRVN